MQIRKAILEDVEKIAKSEVLTENIESMLNETENFTNITTNNEEIEKAFNEKPYYVLIYVLGRSFERADRLLTKIRTDLIESDQRVEFMELDILDRIAFKVGAPSLFVDKLLYAAKKGNEKLQYPERPIIQYIDPWD